MGLIPFLDYKITYAYCFCNWEYLQTFGAAFCADGRTSGKMNIYVEYAFRLCYAIYVVRHFSTPLPLWRERGFVTFSGRLSIIAQ